MIIQFTKRGAIFKTPHRIVRQLCFIKQVIAEPGELINVDLTASGGEIQNLSRVQYGNPQVRFALIGARFELPIAC